jgi:antitoxin YefM
MTMPPEPAAYRAYISNSKHWRYVRELRLQKDLFSCQGCSSKNRLHVHHLTYERVGAELLDDLVTLCWDCHWTVHELYRQQGGSLAEITRIALQLLRAGSSVPRPRDSAKTSLHHPVSGQLKELNVTAISISHARANLFELVRQVNEESEVIEIVARDGNNAVLMSAADYESLRETLFVFSDPANAAHIMRGLDDIRAGNTQEFEIDDIAARFGIKP